MEEILAILNKRLSQFEEKGRFPKNSLNELKKKAKKWLKYKIE